jgi:hypothetical protein
MHGVLSLPVPLLAITLSHIPYAANATIAVDYDGLRVFAGQL